MSHLLLSLACLTFVAISAQAKSQSSSGKALETQKQTCLEGIAENITLASDMSKKDAEVCFKTVYMLEACQPIGSGIADNKTDKARLLESELDDLVMVGDYCLDQSDGLTRSDLPALMERIFRNVSGVTFK